LQRPPKRPDWRRIWRAIRKGRISATKCDAGTFTIDEAELFRVFPPTPTRQRAALEQSAMVLKREIELLREMLNEARRNADHCREQAQTALRALPPPLPRPQPVEQPGWQWWRR
jgi:hypothetical protein